MASFEPIQGPQSPQLNNNTGVHPLRWDCESSLSDFEQALAMLDKISDGLPDDPITTQALNGLHDVLSNIHAEFTTELMAD